MNKTLIQSVTFKGVSSKKLYQTYLNSKQHAAAIGSEAAIEPKIGGGFAAFGMLKGQFLVLIKDKMIVQTWRSVKFKNTDEDSILVLRFEKTTAGGRIDLVHTSIPVHDYADIQKGWPKHYWKPWARYFKK